MGAEGFAVGDRVAFAKSPSLFTAAHEAAHVVQQRAGVALKKHGTPGDVYERHADLVANEVVAGRSAERLLDQPPAPGAEHSAVQCMIPVRPTNIATRPRPPGGNAAPPNPLVNLGPPAPDPELLRQLLPEQPLPQLNTALFGNQADAEQPRHPPQQLQPPLATQPRPWLPNPLSGVTNMISSIGTLLSGSPHGANAPLPIPPLTQPMASTSTQANPLSLLYNQTGSDPAAFEKVRPSSDPEQPSDSSSSQGNKSSKKVTLARMAAIGALAAGFAELRSSQQDKKALADPKRPDRVKEAAHEIPDEDILMEQLAHRLAYGHANPAMLEEQGLVVAEEFEDPKTGFAVTLLVSIHGNRPPVLVFRGTQSAKAWHDDFNLAGVGAGQFAANKQKIKELMAKAGAKVIVTGHSLGGALAQKAAAAFPEHVRRIATFQSPGVNASEADAVAEHNAKNPNAAIKSAHYRSQGDIVHRAGERLTPGRVHTIKQSGVHNPANAHMSLLLPDLNDLRGEPVHHTDGSHGQILSIDNSTASTENARLVGLESTRKAFGSLFGPQLPPTPSD